MTVAGRILSVMGTGSWPGAAWLDGGDGGRGWLGLRPDVQVESDDLSDLDRIHRMWRESPHKIWIGWLTYDLGADAILGRSPRWCAMPGLVFRRYAGAVEIEPGGAMTGHGEECACEELRVALEEALPLALAPWSLGALEAEHDPADYRGRVARIQEFIAGGHTYQVNLSQRFFAAGRLAAGTVEERAAHVYGRLREVAPASMGALVDAGDKMILSNSPETLLDVGWEADPDAAWARSLPIKGTRPRHRNPADDVASRVELRASAKDSAEHVMIVDLVRNDLGRIAVPGTVVARPRPELVSLPTVHHLVSEVSCKLRPGWTLASLASAMFPGGSITGAPKRRTVELIDELEDVPRGIYCGAMVILEPRGTRWSIPIRTGVFTDEGLWLHAGGAVVADSDPEAERVETVVKTWAFDQRQDPRSRDPVVGSSIPES